MPLPTDGTQPGVRRSPRVVSARTAFIRPPGLDPCWPRSEAHRCPIALQAVFSQPARLKTGPGRVMSKGGANSAELPGVTKKRSFPARVLRTWVDPTLVAIPVAVALLWLCRTHQLIADLPLWALILLVGGASILTAVANEAWPDRPAGWRLYMRVGIELTGITVIIYAVGWGPTLVVGLVFGVADCMSLRRERRPPSRPSSSAWRSWAWVNWA